MSATGDNLLSSKVTIEDFGPFPDPTIPKKQETNVFVSEEYGSVNEATLKTIVKSIMQEELKTMLIDMGGFQEIDGYLYYGSKKLVYASDIFFS